MELKRRRFQGVINILSFNRHFYIFGLALLALLILSHAFWQWNSTVFWWIIAAFSYGLFMPLLVSAYVYDFSGFYNFDWLKDLNLPDSEHRTQLNINAGFDETSYIIKHILPHSELQVFDFYNKSKHTEVAIKRARKASIGYPNTRSIETHSIPMEDNSVDAIFLILAIHEIRNQDEKVRFLKECKRVCKKSGQLFLVEHLRNFPNFLAFTIGFTHFFPKSIWMKALNQAGFKDVKERKFTPFMSIFTTEC